MKTIKKTAARNSTRNVSKTTQPRADAPLSGAVASLLFEAYRRNDLARNDSHEWAKPLRQRWLGLGTAAAYRPAINAGLMTFFDGRTPPRRCYGWLTLTDAGVIVFKKHSGAFKKRLDDMKAAGYGSSFRAMYQLAGGISA